MAHLRMLDVSLEGGWLSIPPSFVTLPILLIPILRDAVPGDISYNLREG